MALPCQHGLMRACQQCDPNGFLDWMNGLSAPATFPLPEPVTFTEQYLREAIERMRQADLQPRDDRWIVTKAEYEILVREYENGHCVKHACTFEPGSDCPTCITLAQSRDQD